MSTDFGSIGGGRNLRIVNSDPQVSPFEIDSIYNWKYRREITVTNSGSLENNYQINFSIDTLTLITSGKMLPEGADIRITDTDETSLLSFWVEDINTTTTKIWVLIPTLSSGTKKIYIYYGNPNAASVSSGLNTFDFYDDFEDGSITDWSQAAGAGGSASTTVAKNGIYSMKQIPTTNYAELYRNFSSSFTTDRIYEGWIRTPDNNSARQFQLEVVGGTYNNAVLVGLNLGTFQWYNGSAWVDTGVAFSLNTWYEFKICSHLTTSTYDWYVYNEAGTLIMTKIGATTRGTVNSIQAFSFASLTTSTTYYDVLRVRKYTATEPTSVVGDEITPTTGLGNNLINVFCIEKSTGSVMIGNSDEVELSAILEIKSTIKGLLLPRMTTAQRDLISTPVAGLIIFNSTTNVVNFYNGSAWGAI